jgi:hypothetical protein
MTSTQLFTEILNRCGEGYENWTDRAKAHFKSAIIEIVKSGKFHETQYPGLIFRKEVTGLTGAAIAFTSFVQSGYEFIKWIKMQKNPATTTVYKDVLLMSYPEYLAYTNNSNLVLADQIYAYLLYDGTSVKLNFADAAVSGDKWYPVFVAWNDFLLGLDTSAVYGDELLETAIQLAVAKLKAEIEA